MLRVTAENIFYPSCCL